MYVCTFTVYLTLNELCVEKKYTLCGLFSTRCLLVPAQFATVYKAEDEKENRVVAVKKIKVKLSSSLREGA